MTGFITVFLTSTLIPGVLVIIIVSNLGTGSYISLLTPDVDTKEDDDAGYTDLVNIGITTMLIPVVMHYIFIITLTVNIYCFSEKIFHLHAYTKIL